MSELKELTDIINAFNHERDWEQFHNAKDLAIALSIEANELLEVYLWKQSNEAPIEKVKEELADVFHCAIMLASKYDFDIKEIVLEKLAKTAMKYPVEKAKGNSKKYDEL